MPGGNAMPAPCLPQNASVPIYQMASQQFLVDETGGVVPQPSGRQAMLGISSATLIQTEINLVLNLIGQVRTNEQMQAATATATAMSAGVQTADVQGDGGGFSRTICRTGAVSDHYPDGDELFDHGIQQHRPGELRTVVDAGAGRHSFVDGGGRRDDRANEFYRQH